MKEQTNERTVEVHAEKGAASRRAWDLEKIGVDSDPSSATLVAVLQAVLFYSACLNPTFLVCKMRIVK